MNVKPSEYLLFSTIIGAGRQRDLIPTSSSNLILRTRYLIAVPRAAINFYDLSVSGIEFAPDCALSNTSPDIVFSKLFESEKI
jgi:hypothetical protein